MSFSQRQFDTLDSGRHLGSPCNLASPSGSQSESRSISGNLPEVNNKRWCQVVDLSRVSKTFLIDSYGQFRRSYELFMKSWIHIKAPGRTFEYFCMIGENKETAYM